MSTTLADPVASILQRRWTTVVDLRDRYFPQARDTQQPPTVVWLIWLILAGRGFGKTRTGAEWLADNALTHPHTRWAIVAPTYADARDTCVEGDSGVLSVLHRRGHHDYTWNRSLGEIVLANGSRIKLFSADEPDRMRGPQHHGAWGDEPASWRYPEAFDQLMFGLRLGDDPRVVITGTPKPTKLIRGLVARDDVAVTRGSTFDNEANLAPTMLDEMRRRYEGTRLGRQELHAEILDDVEGALWTQAGIDANRIPVPKDHEEDFDYTDVVVAVDPAVTSGEESDESGIITAGSYALGMCPHCGPLAAGDRHFAVLEDISGRHGTNETSRLVVDTYREVLADRVVVETNNGGDWIPDALRNIDPRVVVTKVTATRGKQLRAQPIAALYEQGRVHHVGMFAELEDQMCSWTPDSKDSPDRMDALVWALTALADVTEQRGRIVDSGFAA
jgi:phage terminase large subunit-like protein